MKRGFTLIELLVVVAVIAVLAALLLPSLRKSIQKANVVKATGNLHTAGMAIDLYRGDNNNFYPFSATSVGGPPYWCDAVAAYMSGTKSVEITDYRGLTVHVTPSLVCPLVPRNRHNNISDYGVNGALLLRQTATGESPQAWVKGPSPLSSLTVPRQAQIALVMTAENTSPSPPYGNWYVNSLSYLTNPNYTQRPDDRGTGFVYCYFVDGHTDAVPLVSMQTNAATYLLPR